MQVDVLIAGAGPTGLVLALWLNRLGVSVRIVDQSDGPGETSRAIVVHARTLEFYRQVGLADQAVEHGIRVQALHLHAANRSTARLELDDIGKQLSPYPFMLGLPQDEHERLLIEALRAAGVEVERQTHLVGFDDTGDVVHASLRKQGSTEVCEARYLCGCDGANSTTRHWIGAGFPGGTYDQIFFVADVRTTNPPAHGELNAYLGQTGFCLVLPVRQSGTLRLIGIVPPDQQAKPEITFADVADQVAQTTQLHVTEVNWFSTYHVHHRVADRFRKGRVFLLGDAGHIHSPAGGQGLNTGVGDAVNLSWKLADVLNQRAKPALLDTYEPERMVFARQLVATTDRAFRVIAGRTVWAALARQGFFLGIAPTLMRFRAIRRALFRLVSQIEIDYRSSPLSSGKAGKIQGGDRIPWVATDRADNFDPLKTLAWQIHVYGAANDALQEAAAALPIPLYQFPWSQSAEAAGLLQNGMYLVRPDGYVALADPNQDARLLQSFVSRWNQVL